MGRRLRYQSKPWATHHVVNRCINGYSFLKPTPEIAAVIRGVFARSLYLYAHSVKLHHIAVLSNHFHLLVSCEHIGYLSAFMRHLKSNLTRELSRIHEWSGSMWQRRYSSEEVLDEESFNEVFKYITENSVKEGLVDHPSEWRGLHGYHQLVERREVRGSWINRTELCQAQAELKKRTLSALGCDGLLDEGDFTTEYEIALVKPQYWSHLSDEDCQARYIDLSEEAIKNARVKMKERGLSTSIGAHAVESADVYQRRVLPHGEAPLCRSASLEAKRAYHKAYKRFKELYQEAYQQLRAALTSKRDSFKFKFPPEGISPTSLDSLCIRVKC